MKKKLKKSQLRNMKPCEKCGKLIAKNKLVDYEIWLPPDYLKTAVIKVCYNCDDAWMDG